jgi:hypothetical protein
MGSLVHLAVLQRLSPALRCFSARAPWTVLVAIVGRGCDNRLAFRPIKLLALRLPCEDNGPGGLKRPNEGEPKAETMVVPHIRCSLYVVATAPSAGRLARVGVSCWTAHSEASPSLAELRRPVR